MNKHIQLVEFIIQDLICLIVEKDKIEFDQAMRYFYASETFEKLQDFETGLYIESSSYIYELYQEELEVGKIVQREI